MNLRTVAILRGYTPAACQAVALRCWEAGMDLVEVPVQDEQGWKALAAVAESADGRPFGAGTVLTVEAVRRVVDLGASVVISPGIDAEVVRATMEAGALPLPGVFTPSDVSLASRLGVGTCKLFPASEAGSGWFSALRGPFPHMRFVAVGGVDLSNAADYLAAGAAGLGFGGSVEQILDCPDPSARIAALHRLSVR